MESPLYEIAPDDLQVIETLRIDPADGACRLALHMDRMAGTCARLRIPFDRQDCTRKIGAIAPATPQRCRVTVDMSGTIEIATARLEPVSARWRVCVSPSRLSSGDPWLGVKTTQRRLYDETRANLPPGADEAIFLNEQGEVCEGTITNVFVRLDGELVTPPLACGVLPGVLRADMLLSGKTKEKPLGLDDLKAADDFFVGNSLRGLIPAALIHPAPDMLVSP